MYRVLLLSILAIGGIFVFLTAVIVLNKAIRETRSAWRRSRRKLLEPKILAFTHGNEASPFVPLGGRLRWRDRGVVEEVLLDHAQRIRGIERERIGRALDEFGYVSRYLDSLDSPRWWKRADGAEKLGLAGAQRATRALAARLEDRVPEVRIRAAKALGAVGGTAAVAPLIAALAKPNRWSTIRVADILSGMRRDVAAGLIEAYPGLNLTAKLAALDILGRVRSADAVGWLTDRLRDPERDVRARACHALGAIGDPNAGPAVAGALEDAEWPVRAMAAKALGRLRHAQVIPDLCAALRDREWWVRANAAEALRLMGPRGIEALDRMLDDQDVYARHQAVLMLEESGILDQQVDLLRNPPSPERSAAESLVRRFVRVGQVSRLRELAESHPDAVVRETLSAVLGAIPRRSEAAS
jgi:HEAT repeat protein